MITAAQITYIYHPHKVARTLERRIGRANPGTTVQAGCHQVKHRRHRLDVCNIDIIWPQSTSYVRETVRIAPDGLSFTIIYTS